MADIPTLFVPPVTENAASPHPQFGLGRVGAKDRRDLLHPMRSAIRIQPRGSHHKIVVTKHWRVADILDQGQLPHCVGYAWRQFVSSAPYMHPHHIGPTATEIYRDAQRMDEWPGEEPEYFGTSVRAGAKALQARQVIGEYVWATTVDEVRSFLLQRGPVVVGTAWHWDMFTPNKQGYIKPTGGIAGGHAYLLVGVSHPRRAFRVVNSWGPDWGDTVTRGTNGTPIGRAWIKWTDFGTLLDTGGEACSAIESRVPGWL